LYTNANCHYTTRCTHTHTTQAQEADAQAKAAATRDIAADAQRDLDEALPALDAAVACLKDLKKADIDEVKSLGKPPYGVKLTMQATCIMFDVKPDKVADPDAPGKKVTRRLLLFLICTVWSYKHACALCLYALSL
jgi:Microtubule-binding stalk of dynein motor